MKNFMFLLVVGSLLTACGGSNNTVSDTSATPTTSTAATTPGTAIPSVLDAFTSKIAELVRTAPEDTEPAAIDTSTAASSEDTEPAAV